MRDKLRLMLCCAGIDCGPAGDSRLDGYSFNATFLNNEIYLLVLDKRGFTHKYICRSPKKAFERILEHA